MTDCGRNKVGPPCKGEDPALPEWVEKCRTILDREEADLKLHFVEKDQQEFARKLKAILSLPHDEAERPWMRKWLLWLLTEGGLGAVWVWNRRKGQENPPWLERMLDRFSSVVAPALNPAAIGRAPAVQFGISVGHALEWALRGRDWDLPGTEKLPEDIARQIRRDFRQRMEIRIELIHQVFAVVCGQPLDINREFFRGVSVGMQKGVISPQGGFTGDKGRTDVYISFLQFSGFIGKLGTMRELHEWLCALLRPNRAGRDIDRLKKLCGDIGLNFRDGQPGRPRKIGEAAGV